MSLDLYRVLHVIGVVFLFAALGGAVLSHWVGVTEAGRVRARKISGITHGVALLLIVFSGFGALARLGLTELAMPGWVWAKLVIWALLGASPFVLRKKPALAGAFWWVLPLLGGLAGYLAVYQPG
ncbi:MAG: hypothetical protein ACLF0P_17110 [Thermoanaerobaculia bacterium]